MATTSFFDEEIHDQDLAIPSIHLEFGRSSYYGGISAMYLTIDGKQVVVDENTGRKIYEAVNQLAEYLGYDR